MALEFIVARSVLVAPQRLAGWVDRFAGRHGDLQQQTSPDSLLLTAANGAYARLASRWAPLPAEIDLPTALDHLVQPPTFGLLLVRKGASAVAVANGTELVAHRVSRHYVQSRTKAGGWSQQRYARRRANQARSAYQDAADGALEVLTDHLPRLDGLVIGGDRVGINEVLADPRLAPIAALPRPVPLLPAPDARLTVLAEAAVTACSIPIDLDAVAVGDDAS